ncbi:MAG TPA: hypothetical protein VM824_06295 [Thermoleophilaceae bacterium]|jgi:hypothetical protein|nr:hypothetical protein [Thermoleophilaceae bacterium]
MRRSRPARDLRTAIDCLPLKTRRAMLGGVEANRIIVGAYTDRSGGVCPMLAAHRNGGRTSLASFARAWDRYTGVRGRRPRPATDRELTTLTTMLEASIALDELPTVSEVVREAKATRAKRLRVFRRFDEYERAVAELATIRALNPPAERTEAREPRSYVKS